eukprot:CAMPEP_0194290364 /NCGR_PEP_ID=MMETSP0169-20130528/41106_1 /TAXON_ID=218684 /ORGANISM="Corethron pennatum, Strain L29A3" /LENGTH=160 /DNA_ID=CAMNT_0039037927 /DNA_START=13 /DNA_END=495 /DNA_ORIENTATION=-
METRLWWRLSSGRALGVLNGMLLEYDKSTLAPLGLVLPAEELLGKIIVVADSGVEECIIDYDMIGEEGDEQQDCEEYQEREQAVLVHGVDNDSFTVIQPNEDGSYWRKIVRNKIARMKERRREKAAMKYAIEILGVEEGKAMSEVISTWGPYTSTRGNAL